MAENERSFHNPLPFEALTAIQDASHRYSWKGVPLWKNPFDFALYWLLVLHCKPGTIIEIGSKHGGSALWLADMLRIYRLDGRVVSIDVEPVTSVTDPLVEFLAGDAADLGACLTDERLAGLRRPWLVIDDASHVYGDCLAILEFFHARLQPGDFVVVEDGIVDDLGISERYDGGPNRAVRDFMDRHGSQYALVTALCDFWGENLTWNPNGYWKRVA